MSIDPFKHFKKSAKNKILEFQFFDLISKDLLLKKKITKDSIYIYIQSYECPSLVPNSKE